MSRNNQNSNNNRVIRPPFLELTPSNIIRIFSARNLEEPELDKENRKPNSENIDNRRQIPNQRTNQQHVI